jgi:PIN domain nuclease of toxin-antitoxin system
VLLLDTHVLLWVLGQTRLDLPARLKTSMAEAPLFASSVSFWEIAIKHRSGKLKLTIELDKLVSACEAYSIGLISLSSRDAIAGLSPLPPTRDPFDRMLLTQCSMRDWKFVTIDGALIDHPIALK